MGAESFTVLAILEARDQASEIFAKIDESLDRFSDTAKSAADTARAAGEAIDESLLQTASGADALDLADARVAAAQARAAQTANELANAERELIAAQSEAAGAADGDYAAQGRLIGANTELAAAAKENAAAQKELAGAQKVQSDTADAAAAKTDIAADSTVAAGAAAGESDGKLGSLAKTAGIVALGMGVAGAVMIKAAGNFQSATTHLVTDAGESAKNLAMVQAGILSISSATGTSAAAVVAAMQHIESAGYHGASGLDVARIAAEGAKVGNADLGTVSKALVGTLNSYYGSTMNASNATQRSTAMMNEMIAIVGSGDMTMQQYASAIGKVAPAAHTADLSLAQVGGAIATMTSQNMSADQAAQDLNHTIGALQNPTSVQTAEMAAMGLSAQKVQSQLGKVGLTGTISELTTAILKHMGPSGAVMLSAFNQSTSAAQDANIMLSKLPASIRGVAKGYLQGTVSYNTWYAAMKSLPLVARSQAQEFAATAAKAHGFNNILTAGGPAAQTYAAALSKMMGGTVGYNTAVMLSGKNTGVFAANVATAQQAADKGGTSVSNWAAIQSTFNQKIAAAKTSIENTGIAIGSALLPAATKLLSAVTKIVTPIAEWTAKHRTLTEILFMGVAGIAATVAAVGMASKAFKAVSGAVNDVKKAVGLAQAGLQKLGIISKQAADKQEASAKQAAAAQEEAAATEEEAAGEAAAANEEAAAESSSSWIASAGQQIAAAASWVAENTAKVATVVAQNVAAAATTAGSWIAAGASQVASAAVWVAQSLAKVAVMVAANVAGAVATAAAWVVANAAMLGGIGLIVLAVVAAVVLIVKHWKQISAEAARVFHDVLAVVDSVISWVKSHWPLLLAILIGPFGLAALFIIRHYDQIRDGAAHMIGDVTGFFRSLPGRILGALGDVGHLLWSAGAKVVQGLIGGLESEIGAVEHTASSIVDTIKSFLPFSPAKRGPLSGGGAPENSGAAIARNIGKGMLSATPQAVSAARSMAASVLAATAGLAGSGHVIGSTLAGGAISAVPAAGGAAGGGVTVNLTINEPHMMSDSDMDKFIGKMGPKLSRMLGQAGIKVRMG